MAAGGRLPTFQGLAGSHHGSSRPGQDCRRIARAGNNETASQRSKPRTRKHLHENEFQYFWSVD